MASIIPNPTSSRRHFVRAGLIAVSMPLAEAASAHRLRDSAEQTLIENFRRLSEGERYSLSGWAEWQARNTTKPQ